MAARRKSRGGGGGGGGGGSGPAQSDLSSCSDMDVSLQTRADSKRRLRVKEAEAATMLSPAQKKFAPRKTMASDLIKDSKSHKPLDPYDGDSENTSSQSDCPLSPKRRSMRLSSMEARVLSPRNTTKVKAPAAATPMSQRVRRSYTRLRPDPESSPHRSSHTSTLNEAPVLHRPSLFGFESLLSPEPLEDVFPLGGSVPREPLHRLSAALDQASLEQASPGKRKPWLPGIDFGDDKSRQKRRKLAKMGVLEFDSLAAEMNAEFDEAEKFDLIIE